MLKPLQQNNIAHTCNAFTPKWQAIIGCEGKTKQWHHGPTLANGFCPPVFVCPACRKSQEEEDAIKTRDGREARTARIIEAAGIDWFTARVEYVDGRPVIADPGKVSQ